MLPEGGKKLVATFAATIDVNGSSVKCGALEGFTLVVMTDPVYVYIQGTGDSPWTYILL